MSQDQPHKLQLSGAFQRAMQIPGADYATPQSLNVDPEETMLVGMCETGVTSAHTSKPILGTDCFDPCLALIIYNPRTKTAAIGHEGGMNEEYFSRLLSNVRSCDDDIVHLHLMGAPVCVPDNPWTPDPEQSNTESQAMLNKLAVAFEATPSLIVKTFDVYDKPKPSAVAIDTRDGKLIRGSDLRLASQLDPLPECLFDRWDRFFAPGDDCHWTAPGVSGPS